MRGTGTKKILVRHKEGIRAGGSRVGTPLFLPKTTAFGIAVNTEMPGELPNGNLLPKMSAADLLPRFPSNHTLLLRPAGLREYDAVLLSHLNAHYSSSF